MSFRACLQVGCVDLTADCAAAVSRLSTPPGNSVLPVLTEWLQQSRRLKRYLGKTLLATSLCGAAHLCLVSPRLRIAPGENDIAIVACQLWCNANQGRSSACQLWRHQEEGKINTWVISSRWRNVRSCQLWRHEEEGRSSTWVFSSRTVRVAWHRSRADRACAI